MRLTQADWTVKKIKAPFLNVKHEMDVYPNVNFEQRRSECCNVDVKSPNMHTKHFHANDFCPVTIKKQIMNDF